MPPSSNSTRRVGRHRRPDAHTGSIGPRVRVGALVQRRDVPFVATSTRVEQVVAPSSLIQRMASIIEAFEHPLSSLTLEEVASRAGLARPTTHRILDQLVRSRWLKQIAGVDHCPTGSGQCPRVLVPLGGGSRQARRRAVDVLARSPGGERAASRLAVLSWSNRCGINRMPGAGNSLSRPLVSASDSDMGISAFQWWAA
jgi:hypothetical protein